MKTIKCDICGRELGKEVDTGSFVSWGSGAKYNPYEINIDNGICPSMKPSIADICSECFIKIAEAQRKAIEEIQNNRKEV